MLFIATMCVNYVPMTNFFKIHFLNDSTLQRFNFLIVKFENLTTIQTNDVIMMLVIKKFVYFSAVRINQGFF